MTTEKTADNILIRYSTGNQSRAWLKQAIIDALDEQRALLTQAATVAAERSIDVAMELVIKAEREECAQIAERAISLEAYTDKRTVASHIAAAIRARSADKGKK